MFCCAMGWGGLQQSQSLPILPQFINNLLINPSLGSQVGRGAVGLVGKAIPPFHPAVPRNLTGSNRIRLLRLGVKEDPGLWAAVNTGG